MVNKDINKSLLQCIRVKDDFAGLLMVSTRTRRGAKLVKWAKRMTVRAHRRLSKVLARDIQ